jgi:alpha-1,3-mannosyltransferase
MFKILQSAAWLIPLMLVAETVLSFAIVHFVRYTEIDWEAYMDEVRGYYVHGITDYTQLKGDTGPLVYPAGFVYLYGWLNSFTADGSNIRLGQYAFVAFYVLTVAAVLCIYAKCKLSYQYLIAACCSRRVHSIFMLRLFNDGPCMLLFYVSVLAYLCRYYRVSAVLYSLALSIKMNVLLFLPGYLWLWLLDGKWWLIAQNSLLVLLTQVALGWPFLSTYPSEYLSKAFEFSRVFFFKWTVNWNFVGEPFFLHPWFSHALLVCHGFLLVFFLFRAFSPFKSSIKDTIACFFSPPSSVQTTAKYKVAVLFVCNFVGILCARTLHYQFYSWYWHTLPFLLHLCSHIISAEEQFLILFVIELCWNLYPPSSIASVMLLLCHGRILAGLITAPVWNSISIPSLREKQDKKRA